ncbi:MAG: helix-turn-helix domain-containing protein [Anaerolineae bacterium]|nr:helix-turn-helix domain-containing protein [Anaerolineae bacterium]
MDQETPAKLNNPRWLTLREAAQRLGVHASTVRRWTDSGDLLCARTPGGHRRFLEEHLDAFLRSCQTAAVVTSPDALTKILIRVTRPHIDGENVSGKAWHAAFNESERTVRREIRATRSSPSIPRDAEDIAIRRNLLNFTDTVFCAAMDAYEQTLRHMVGSESVG